ncbi:esterase/lipase family protein [Paenarthrobacter sp. NPDC056912]|uniref:esterase/lipase family protein n=1 Tax=Paenarthrobacter sp. NPDC056912 TaxID=3345965 RepID=UPI0036707AF4
MKGVRVMSSVLAAALTLGIVVSVGSPARADEPASWTSSCNVPGLAFAPVISKDQDNSRTPVKVRADARGKYVPIVYVHGWTGASTHNEAAKGAFSAKPDLLTSKIGTAAPTRTLIGNVQDLGGTAVFTFDYEKYASRWVTDSNIGRPLADALNCLYDRSGEKVIVVAHSMGGLATRQALGLGGSALAAKVSQVITFGTPNTGSIGAAVAALGVEAAGLTNVTMFVFRMWLSYCGKLKSEDLNRSDLLCAAFLPAWLLSFDSEAAKALRSGSQQLRDLPPWPSGLPVHSLAGAAQFTLVGQGFFKQEIQGEAGVGDIVVDLGSAQAGATTKKQAACSYEMEGYTNVFNGIRTDWLGIATKNEVSRSFVNLLTQPIPCFHGNLMRNMDLALEQLGYIADDVQSRIPTTKVVTIRPWVDGSEANPNRVIDGRTAKKAFCSGSNVAGRADAFRCFVDQGVHDPCLQNPAKITEYLCYFGLEKVLIQNVRADSTRVPSTTAPEQSSPFLVTLADGTVCRTSSGAGPPAIQGYPYWAGSCSGPHSGIWRARDADRGANPMSGLLDKTSSGTWHIAIEEDAKSGKVTLYPVALAYR